MLLSGVFFFFESSVFAVGISESKQINFDQNVKIMYVPLSVSKIIIGESESDNDSARMVCFIAL